MAICTNDKCLLAPQCLTYMRMPSLKNQLFKKFNYFINGKVITCEAFQKLP